MRKPAPWEKYRHFKGGKYQVLMLARNADTGEEIVVYQALYGDYTVYCRPLSEFTSEVDRDKYPNADQRMRFERFEDGPLDEDPLPERQPRTPVKEGKDSDVISHAEEKKSPEKESPVITPEKSKIPETGALEAEDDTSYKGDYMNRTIEEEAEDFGMNPLVVRFLDADSSAKRLEVLNLIRPVVTNDMIDVMAMAIDTEIPGDDPDERCVELRECLLTRQRFEVTRLR